MSKALSGKGGGKASAAVVFTLVSEPPEGGGGGGGGGQSEEEEEQECLDVGRAELDLASVLRSGRDIVDASVEVFRVKAEEEEEEEDLEEEDEDEDEDEPIGTFTLSIIAREALRALVKKS